MVANGLAELPALASLPAGETKSSVAAAPASDAETSRVEMMFAKGICVFMVKENW
jgi:hypothetical protein